MGCNLLAAGGGASFRVWAPNAQTVQVLLWDSTKVAYAALPLTADPTNGAYYSADISGVAAGDRYRFSIVNDATRSANNPGGIFQRIDPYARDVAGSDAESPALATAAPTPVTGLQTPADYIIYQMHVGSLVGLNDSVPVVNRTATFQQIAANALGRIASLGFTAVQFLPTTEDPESQEGYAPANYFAPEINYGKPVDLAKLVDACHQAGLAVFFDVVYNHAIADYAFDRLLQFDGNTVNNSRGIYFSVKDNFGPVPDFDRPEVQTFFVDNARQCFREYGVDGLRFDSAMAIQGANYGPQPLIDMIGLIRKDFPSKFLIAEHNNPLYAVTTLGFDASWQMDSCDTFVNLVLGRDIGALEGLVSNTLNLPNSRSRVSYVLGSHDQIYADYESDNGATPTTDKPDNRYFVERVGGVLVGRNQPSAQALARVGWVVNVAMPCLPMMFMGSECHHWGYWDPYMDSYGEHRLDHNLLADPIGKPMASLVGDANRFRANHASLRGSGYLSTHRDTTNAVLGFKRFDNAGDVLLFVVNLGSNRFGAGGYDVSLAGDGGQWLEVFNSQAPVYGGFANSGNYGIKLDGSGGQLSIALPEQSVLVFQKQ
jgi:1,4-alpha-glucan branching enzyme